MTGAVPEWLVPAVRDVRAARPGLRLFLLVNTSDVLVDALLAGTLDLAIGRCPRTRIRRASTASRSAPSPYASWRGPATR